MSRDRRADFPTKRLDGGGIRARVRVARAPREAIDARARAATPFGHDGRVERGERALIHDIGLGRIPEAVDEQRSISTGLVKDGDDAGAAAILRPRDGCARCHLGKSAHQGTGG